MIPVHEHFRFHDGNQPRLLTDARIAGQGMGVGLDAGPAGKPLSDRDDRAPLGKPCTHLIVLGTALGQPVQSMSDLLVPGPGQRLRAAIHLDARDNAEIRQVVSERGSIQGFLADGLIE